MVKNEPQYPNKHNYKTIPYEVKGWSSVILKPFKTMVYALTGLQCCTCNCNMQIYNNCIYKNNIYISDESVMYLRKISDFI